MAQAVRKVAAGEALIQSRLTRKVLAEFFTSGTATDQQSSLKSGPGAETLTVALTERELQVLQALATASRTGRLPTAWSLPKALSRTTSPADR